MAYYGMYKCRLCGETYIRCSVPDKDIAVRHFIGLTNPIKTFKQIETIDMHSCKNGNLGLADFQGFEDDCTDHEES